MEELYYLSHFLCAKPGDRLPLRLQEDLDLNDERDYDDETLPEEDK